MAIADWIRKRTERDLEKGARRKGARTASGRAFGRVTSRGMQTLKRENPSNRRVTTPANRPEPT